MKQDAFLIPINAISIAQISAIKDFIDNTGILAMFWTIKVTEKCVYGYTFYEDRGFMHDFIMSLDLNKKYIYWSEPDGLELDDINRSVINSQRKEKLNKIHDKTRN